MYVGSSSCYIIEGLKPEWSTPENTYYYTSYSTRYHTLEIQKQGKYCIFYHYMGSQSILSYAGTWEILRQKPKEPNLYMGSQLGTYILVVVSYGNGCHAKQAYLEMSC